MKHGKRTKRSCPAAPEARRAPKAPESSGNSALAGIKLLATMSTATLSPGVAVALSGGVANVVECVVMHPLDTAKTRLQLLQHTVPSASSQLGHIHHSHHQWCQNLCLDIKAPGLRAVLLELVYGGPRVLYRGLLPAVGMQLPRGMLKFVMSSRVSSAMAGDWWTSARAGRLAAAGLGGLAAGASESVLITPFELLKVRLQAAERLGTHRHSFDALQQLARAEGVGALWLGLRVTMLRNGLWNAVYFATIKGARDKPRDKALHSRGGRQKAGNETLLETFAFGALGGALGSCFSNPLDVVKSRIQARGCTSDGQGAAARATGSLLQQLWTVASTEGPTALYKGFGAKLLRLGPGGGILLLVYHTAYGVLAPPSGSCDTTPPS
eukprot:m.177033 g.177033  ORF g.177033 m.177033 type:complete len:382 (-) comp17958_c0_seq3:34-1179(-)